jgi:hypothetical protein
VRVCRFSIVIIFVIVVIRVVDGCRCTWPYR